MFGMIKFIYRIHTESRLKMQNLLYKNLFNSISPLYSVCTISDIKSIIIEKEPLRNHNATEIIRKLALAIDARSDTCENDLYCTWVYGSACTQSRHRLTYNKDHSRMCLAVSKRSIEICVWFRYGTPMRVIHQLKEGAANFLSIPNSI